jgi:hypothetical protein
MGNRGAKSLTFHKLLHFKFTGVVLIQELRSKVHTSHILPRWTQTYPPDLLTDLNIIPDHPFQIAVLIQFNRWSNNLKQVAKSTNKTCNEVVERVAIGLSGKRS